MRLTRDQIREVDRLAIEELGIPGAVLMENAGRHTADAVLDLLEHTEQIVAADARVAIVCGGGNNGGDGFVIARHLHNAQVRQVDTLATKPLNELAGDALIHARVADRMGLVTPLTDPDAFRRWFDERPNLHVVVDALLGTGFRGRVRDDVAAKIDTINTAKQRGAFVVAVDVPSGFDCETGEAAGPAVLADLTMTFVAEKVGFAAHHAETWLGQVVVVDIGAPPELIRRVLRPVHGV